MQSALNIQSSSLDMSYSATARHPHCMLELSHAETTTLPYIFKQPQLEQFHNIMAKHNFHITHISLLRICTNNIK